MKTIKKKHIGFLFRGKRLRRLPGVIFWWAWGKTEFDIRTARAALGQERERKEDTMFGNCGAYHQIVDHLDKITGTRDFREVLKEAEEITFRESREFLLGATIQESGSLPNVKVSLRAHKSPDSNKKLNAR